MPSSPFPFQEEVKARPIAKNIFNFFNIKELSTISSVCKSWKQFIMDDIYVHDQRINNLISKYKQYFKLYYSESGDGFLLNVATNRFFVDNPNGILERILNEEVVKELGFLRPCHEVSYTNSTMNMFFWSPDGINFYFMQERCKKANGIVEFSTSEEEKGTIIICQIKFTSSQAMLLEPSVLKNTNEIEKLMLQFDDSKKQCNPNLKTLKLFEVCPSQVLDRLLQFMLSGKIKIIPYKEKLKPLYLFHSDELDLFIGTQGERMILKIKKKELWEDLSFSSEMYDYQTALLQFRFDITHEFKSIKLEKNENATLAHVKTQGGNFDLIQVPLMEVELSQLNFIDRITQNPRKTPLEIIGNLNTIEDSLKIENSMSL